MYLKNLTYFVLLSTRKNDFCFVKSDQVNYTPGLVNR